MDVDLIEGEAIVRLTGLRRAADQLRFLRERIGCYAWMRADNTVATTAHHLHQAGAAVPKAEGEVEGFDLEAK